MSKRSPLPHHRLAKATRLEVATPCWVVNPDAPVTIIMLHGFRGSHRGMLPLASALDGYRLIIPDLPGMGLAPALRPGATVADYADWLQALVSELRLDRFILFGHSLGALVSLNYTLRHPSKVHRLIMLAPAPKPSLTEYLASLYYLAGKPMPITLAKRWFRSQLVQKPIRLLTMRTTDPQIRRWLLSEGNVELSELQPRAHVDHYFASLKAQPASWISQLKTKTLVLAGTRDIITPPARVQRTYGNHDHVQLELLPGMGHFGFAEAIPALAFAIEQWLNAPRSYPQPAAQPPTVADPDAPTPA